MVRKRLRPFDAHVARTGNRIASREREPVPNCWFCTEPVGKSKEHIFPKWLTGDLGVREFQVTPTHGSLFGGEDHEMSRRPLAGLVATRICQRCNNGWMSALETRVRPLLTGVGLSRQVSPEQATILAQWFAKTAAVLNVSQNYRMVIRAADRHALASGLPNIVAVAISRVERSDDKVVDWQQSSPMLAVSPYGQVNDYAKDLLERTLVCNIQAGALGGTVVFAARPLDASHVENFSGGVPIWPLPGRLPWVSALPRVESVRMVMPTLRIPVNPFLAH